MFSEVIRIISIDDFRLSHAEYVFNGSRRIPDPTEPQTHYPHQCHPSKGLPHAVSERERTRDRETHWCPSSSYMGSCSGSCRCDLYTWPLSDLRRSLRSQGRISHSGSPRGCIPRQPWIYHFYHLLERKVSQYRFCYFRVRDFQSV